MPVLGAVSGCARGGDRLVAPMLVLGAGRWCCELCRCGVPGAGAGAVSWLRTWWRQVAGAGCRAPGAGGARGLAGAVSWLCARETNCFRVFV